MAATKGDDGTPSGFNPDPAKPFGVWGDSGSAGAFGGGGNGILGSSKYSSGVAGFTLSTQLNAAGVFGEGAVGICGYATGANSFPSVKVGVYGTGAGPSRQAAGGIGVIGEADSNIGVYGESDSGPGIAGFTTSGAGVRGVSAQNVGVFGVSTGTGVLGWGGALAALFIGDVEVTGNLMKAGGGFVIDHPWSPGNKVLRHSFVESPDMKNVYDGVVRCNAKGDALVRLPSWFESLNSDYRYQLTPIGAPAPNLFISSGVKDGRFTIAGGTKNLRVSWQVTGIRKDPWAKAHRIIVEEKKPAKDLGELLHPDVHGAMRRRAIHHALSEDARSLLAQKTKRRGYSRRGRSS